MLTAISRLRKYKKMTLEEKGALLDALCAIESNGGGFFVDTKFTIPMTTTQIAEMLGIGESEWEEFKKNMVDGKILREFNGGVYCPYMSQVSSDSMSDDSQEMARSILAFWNNKRIITHKETPSILKQIINYVRKHNYTLPQIEDAISNYEIILNGDEYFWSYKWTLQSFLSRGVSKFHSSSDPFSSFKKHDKQKSGRSIMAPRSYNELSLEDEL